MAIAGAEHGAPKWIFLDSPNSQPVTHLEAVALRLRELLSGDQQTLPIDKQASELIERFLNRVLETESLLLPRKKQRALSEMELVLAHYLKQAEQSGDRHRSEVLRGAKTLLEIPVHEQERPDLDAVAEAWLDLIRDAWYERLSQRRRFKPLRLKDIRKDLKNKLIATSKIEEAFTGIPSARPIHSRVVSAIVGVPAKI
jgi:hypothetical protein